MNHMSLAVALGAGLVSFLSPCVLPLVPGYLSFVAGVSIEELKNGQQLAVASEVSEGGGVATVTVPQQAPPVQGRVIANTVAFVLGFSLVFVLLGASATALGSFLLAKQHLLAQIAGAVVILFGLHTVGLLKIPFLYQERRAQITRKPAGLVGSFMVGLAFAFGWTPCIGPVLAGILSLAATQQTLGAGIELLVAYSAGLAIPFLLTALAFNRLMAVFDQVKRHMRTVELVSGGLLIGVGALIMTNSLTILSAWAQNIPFLAGFSR